MYNRYERWTKNFFESWKNLEGVKTTELISKNVKYYETALGEPCSSFDDVIELWKIVPTNQSNISYEFEIVAYNTEKCVVNWRMSRIMNNTTTQRIDGIIIFSLDEDDKCSYFKQWRYTE